MADSASVAFGSKKLPPGFSTLPQNKPIPSNLKTQAAEILAFDLLVQNPDRRPENPNCLSNGDDYAIFDHELAFMTEGLIGWRPPWEGGGLEAACSRHIFFSGLKGSNRLPDFSRLYGKWTAISPVRLDEYRAALPPEWAENGGAADSSLKYLGNLIENIDSAFANVTRVLV
jgi:hypothetical protein